MKDVTSETKIKINPLVVGLCTIHFSIFVNFVADRRPIKCSAAKVWIGRPSDCAQYPYSLNSVEEFFFSSAIDIDAVIIIEVMIITMLLKY